MNIFWFSLLIFCLFIFLFSIIFNLIYYLIVRILRVENYTEFDQLKKWKGFKNSFKRTFQLYKIYIGLSMMLSLIFTAAFNVKDVTDSILDLLGTQNKFYLWLFLVLVSFLFIFVVRLMTLSDKLSKFENIKRSLFLRSFLKHLSGVKKQKEYREWIASVLFSLYTMALVSLSLFFFFTTVSKWTKESKPLPEMLYDYIASINPTWEQIGVFSGYTCLAIICFLVFILLGELFLEKWGYNRDLAVDLIKRK